MSTERVLLPAPPIMVRYKKQPFELHLASSQLETLQLTRTTSRARTKTHIVTHGEAVTLQLLSASSTTGC